MPSFCAAVGCASRHRKGGDISFHSFPHRRPHLMWQWLQAMGRPNMQPKSHHKICSKHFEKSCLFAGMDRPCLRPNAVPTLFSCACPETKTLTKKLLQIPRARSSSCSSEEPNGMIVANETAKGSPAVGCQSMLKSTIMAGRKSATYVKALPKGLALSKDRNAQRNIGPNKKLSVTRKLPTLSKTIDARRLTTETRMDSKQSVVPDKTASQMVVTPAREIAVERHLAATGESTLYNNPLNHRKLPKQLAVRNITNEGTETSNFALDDSPRRLLQQKRRAEANGCVPLKKRPFQNTLPDAIAPRGSLGKDPSMSHSDLASPSMMPVPGELGGGHSTVNRLLDSGSSESATTAAEALFLHTYCSDERTSPRLFRVSKTLQDTRQKLFIAECKLRRKEQTLRQQQTTIDELQKQLSLVKRASEGFRVSNRLPTDLIRDWHENASRVSHGHRYRPTTFEFAAGLFACSSQAYRFISEWFPMPSIQLMRRHMAGTVVPNASFAPLETLEIFGGDCETPATETQQALAALETALTLRSAVEVLIVEQDTMLVSPQEA